MVTPYLLLDRDTQIQIAHRTTHELYEAVGSLPPSTFSILPKNSLACKRHGRSRSSRSNGSASAVESNKAVSGPVPNCLSKRNHNDIIDIEQVVRTKLPAREAFNVLRYPWKMIE
jgi:hypothetical protein